MLIHFYCLILFYQHYSSVFCGRIWSRQTKSNKSRSRMNTDEARCYSALLYISSLWSHINTAQCVSMIKLSRTEAQLMEIHLFQPAGSSQSVWPRNLLPQLCRPRKCSMKLRKGFVCISGVLVCVRVTLTVTCWSSAAAISLFVAQSDASCLFVDRITAQETICACENTHSGSVSFTNMLDFGNESVLCAIWDVR